MPESIDPDEELKGLGLMATWPDHLRANQLFSVLTPPRADLLGAYRAFLFRDPIQHLEAVGTNFALMWAEKQLKEQERREPYGDFDIERLLDLIIRRAFEYLESPRVLKALGRVVRLRLAYGERLFFERSSFESLHERRMEILAALAPELSVEPRDFESLAYQLSFSKQDVPWFVLKAKSARRKQIQKAWSRLIATYLDMTDQEHVQLVYDARSHNTPIRDETLHLFGPVDVNSEVARQLRDRSQRQQAYEEKAAQWRRTHSPSITPAQRIEKWLEALESGDLEAWWLLNLDMTLGQESTNYGDEFQPDLTLLPAWKTLSDAVKQRIYDAAEGYLRKQSADPDRWIGQNIIYRPDWSAFRALQLLWKERPEKLVELPESVWQQWATVIVGYRVLSGSGDDTPQQALVKIAYRYAPSVVIDTLAVLLTRDGQDVHDTAYTLRKVADCWDQQLAESLLALLELASLSPEAKGAILAWLLDHSAPAARSKAESYLPIPLPQDAYGRKLAVSAAQALLSHTDDGGWRAVWPAFRSDARFAEEVLASIFWQDDLGRGVAERLTVGAMADLFIQLEHQYPRAEDPQFQSAHMVEFRERIGQWRDSLLHHIVAHRSAEARAELARIVTMFPGHSFAQWALGEAEKALRYLVRPRITPAEIRTLLSSPEARLVQNADQLLEVVIESLQRLEARLQVDETRAAIDLWSHIDKATMRSITATALKNLRQSIGSGNIPSIDDYTGQFGLPDAGTFRPKDENRLSDYIKRHLDNDLKRRNIVFNREVENRRGDITDVRVEAFVRDQKGHPIDPVTVLIEVKGAWHRELDSAMQTQLLNRYMHGTANKHGIYIVGWFYCDSWDNTDRRKGQAKRNAGTSLGEARVRFAQQAAGLSGSGFVVRAVVVDASLS